MHLSENAGILGFEVRVLDFAWVRSLRLLRTKGAGVNCRC